MTSIIIPVLNEEEHIRPCIESLRQDGSVCEIIVVDGGSSDRTVEITGNIPDVKIVSSGKGRGVQMNAGAFEAGGDVLVFLHADTVLEKGWLLAVEKTLVQSDVAGGAFTFAIDGPAFKWRLVEQWVKLRCFLFRLPYGDQAVFVRKEVFNILGGYKDIPLMEDVEFVGRLKKAGKLIILSHKALTSGRRWLKNGILYNSLLNQYIMILYRLGISSHRLARIYYR
jgi:rSAM/selenodomain-associated transferase 2